MSGLAEASVVSVHYLGSYFQAHFYSYSSRRLHLDGTTLNWDLFSIHRLLVHCSFLHFAGLARWLEKLATKCMQTSRKWDTMVL